jgi:hypothetical protein
VLSLANPPGTLDTEALAEFPAPNGEKLNPGRAAENRYWPPSRGAEAVMADEAVLLPGLPWSAAVFYNRAVRSGPVHGNPGFAWKTHPVGQARLLPWAANRKVSSCPK